MTNTSKRIIKLESSVLKKQVKTLSENINKVSDNEINFLCDLFFDERKRRGLVERSEIVAARALYDHLIENKKLKPATALKRVMETVKESGFELTEDDIFN